MSEPGLTQLVLALCRHSLGIITLDHDVYVKLCNVLGFQPHEDGRSYSVRGWKQ